MCNFFLLELDNLDDVHILVDLNRACFKVCLLQFQMSYGLVATKKDLCSHENRTKLVHASVVNSPIDAIDLAFARPANFD